MNEFIVQLMAKLDTSQVIKDINELNRQLNEQNIKLKPILDFSSTKSELQEFAKQLQTAINQASNGKLNIDTNQILNSIEQVSKEINNVTSKTNKIQFSINTGTYESKIANLESQFKRLGLSQDEVAKKMSSVKSAYQSLTANGVGQEELIKREQVFNTELTTTSNHLKILKAEMSEFVSSTKQINLTNKIEKWLMNNTRATKEARQELKLYLNELNSGQITKGRYTEISNNLTKIDTGMRSIGKLGKSFTNSFIEGIKKFSYWTSSTFVIMKAIQSIKGGLSSVRELDTALVDLKKTTTMTGSELEKFYYNSNETAKQMGVTTQQIIEQASAWSRLGFSSAEAATKMAKYSSMFTTISPGMDLDSATDGLVSVMKAFDIGLENTDDVVDGIMSKINIIGNTQALSNNDIVEFLTRSSSAMAEANNSLEETIALGTAAVEITRDAASVGNALKTISMRIRGYDEETEEYIGNIEKLSGKIANLTKTASTPGGISLFTNKEKTEYKSTKQLLDGISKIYGDLTDKDQAALLEALAGKRQGQIVAAILNNYETVSKAMDSMANSAGNAEAEMEVAMDSIDYRLNRLKETGTGISQNLFDRQEMKSFIDVLTKLAEALDFVTDKVGLFGTVGLGAGLFAGIKNVGGKRNVSPICYLF